VNNYRFAKFNQTQQINIPVEMTWDTLGRGDAIDVYENEVLDLIVNPTEDFEVTRYAHKMYGQGQTDINYQFFFLPAVNQVTASTVSDWVMSYTAETFTNKEIYYFANSFKNSFFKIDFYNSNITETQEIRATIIIPTQQGNTVTSNIGTGLTVQNVEIKTPDFVLDYVGDKEGFFVYWLKNPTYITETTFYMSAKFYNAKTGDFIRMMTEPQASLPNEFNFDKSKYFYYKVNVDYANFEYDVTNLFNVRVGTSTNPIKWYEYINP